MEVEVVVVEVVPLHPQKPQVYQGREPRTSSWSFTQLRSSEVEVAVLGFLWSLGTSSNTEREDNTEAV